MDTNTSVSCRIALITDLHTGAEEDVPFDINLRQNFLTVLDAVRAHDPSHLFIAGDLCLLEGNKDIYSWQKKHFDALDIPYHIIIGNHDDAWLLSSIYDQLPTLQKGELFYEIILAGYQILMLDTSQGEMSAAQKKWLKQKLANPSSSPSIVVMHHPPDLMNVPYMDEKHFLKDRVDVMQIFRDAQHPIEIFCGHYHVEKTVSFGHFRVHVTPSCYFQIDAFSGSFQIDHTQIAYRLIDLYNDRIDFSLHYLPGAKI